MRPTLKISETVLNRLLKVKEVCLGNLYGIFYNKTQYIIGLYVNNNDINSSIVQYLPTEVELCGLFEVSDGMFDHSKLQNTIKNVLVTDNPVYLKVNIGTANNIQANFIVNGQPEAVRYEVLQETDLHSQFVYIRLKAQLPLICIAEEDSIVESLNELKKHFDSGKAIFHFEKKNLYILCNEVENAVCGGVSGDSTVGELVRLTYTDDSTYRSRPNTSALDVLQARMYKKVTQDGVIEPKRSHAPIVCVDKKKYESLVMVLNLDALSMVHNNLPVKNLFEILLESSCRNIQILQRTVLKHFHQNAGDHSKISYPEIFHFYPQILGHFVTRVYAKNESECCLESDRKLLHQKLLLPTRQPFFRRVNRYSFRGDFMGLRSQLLNVHEGVKPTANGGEIALVKGKYRYYHYCQDNMDDNGWGCAYRSLQTLASWFYLQGYAEHEVPTFKQIQTCLVDIGDKPSSFIGSRQWIGSTEVNFVLYSLLNITSKILACSNAEEIATYGPELVNHFNVIGSPIMIGGGVLAHTILGVDYNRDTGDIKFLVLDPHYTGNDCLQLIQSKGWCGWKGMEFWDKTSFYNLCLPQTSHCI